MKRGNTSKIMRVLIKNAQVDLTNQLEQSSQSKNRPSIFSAGIQLSILYAIQNYQQASNNLIMAQAASTKTKQ